MAKNRLEEILERSNERRAKREAEYKGSHSNATKVSGKSKMKLGTLGIDRIVE